MFACLSFAHSLLCGLPALLFAAFLLCRGAAASLWTCCEGLRLRGVGQPFGQGAGLWLSSCDGKEAGSLVEGPRNTKGWDLVGMGFWWGKEGLGFSSQPTSEGVSLQGHVGLAPAGALGYNSCEWQLEVWRASSQPSPQIQHPTKPFAEGATWLAMSPSSIPACLLSL